MPRHHRSSNNRERESSQAVYDGEEDYPEYPGYPDDPVGGSYNDVPRSLPDIDNLNIGDDSGDPAAASYPGYTVTGVDEQYDAAEQLPIQSSHEGYEDPEYDQYENEYNDYGPEQQIEDDYEGEHDEEYDEEEGEEAVQQAIHNSRQTGYYGNHPGESSYGQATTDFADPLALSQLTRTETKNIYTVRGTRGGVEKADPRFRVHYSKNFYVGAVFVVLWSEPRGYRPGAVPDDDRATVITRNDFHITYRRFIVVASDSGNSTCVPVLTYEFRGCNKSGVKPDKHGIIYSEGNEPMLLPGERELGFPPVMLTRYEGDQDYASDDLGLLDDASRVNYSKLVTIEHNVKVKFIGEVNGDDLETVKYAVNTCWAKKLHRQTKPSHGSHSTKHRKATKKDGKKRK